MLRHGMRPLVGNDVQSAVGVFCGPIAVADLDVAAVPTGIVPVAATVGVDVHVGAGVVVAVAFMHDQEVVEDDARVLVAIDLRTLASRRPIVVPILRDRLGREAAVGVVGVDARRAWHKAIFQLPLVAGVVVERVQDHVAGILPFAGAGGAGVRLLVVVAPDHLPCQPVHEVLPLGWRLAAVQSLVSAVHRHVPGQVGFALVDEDQQQRLRAGPLFVVRRVLQHRLPGVLGWNRGLRRQVDARRELAIDASDGVLAVHVHDQLATEDGEPLVHLLVAHVPVAAHIRTDGLELQFLLWHLHGKHVFAGRQELPGDGLGVSRLGARQGATHPGRGAGLLVPANFSVRVHLLQVRERLFLACGWLRHFAFLLALRV